MNYSTKGKLLSGIFVLLVSGCAEKKPINSWLDVQKDDSFKLSDIVDKQERQIRKLQLQVGELQRQIEALRKVEPKKASLSTERKKKTVPLEVVLPKTDALPSDETAEVIADSSFENMYLFYQGQQHIKEKKWDSGINALRQFIQLNPNHVYLDQAQSEIVKALYESKEYTLCVVAANQLIGKYPGSFRRGDALYYRGLSEWETGRREEAKLTLEEVIQKHAKDRAARSARAKLSEIEKVTQRAERPVLLDRTAKK